MLAARRRAAVTASTTIAVIVVACGSSSTTTPADNGEANKSSTQIIQDTANAYRAATAVHLVGAVVSSGQRIGLDFHITRIGNVSGTVTFGGVTASVVIVDGKTYLKGRELFAQFAGTPAASVIGEQWVVVPASEAGPLTGGFSFFTDFGKLADQLTQPSGTVAKGALTTINGQPAITLTDSQSMLFVATTGKPYPLELKPNNDPSQRLDFTEYDQSFPITAPTGALDFSSISGGGSSSSSTTP